MARQYNIQQPQQLSLTSMMYPHMRPTGPPQTYGTVDPSTVSPLVGPASPSYGRTHHGVQFHTGRSGRRGDLPEHDTVRSALLDDFRANKTGKWELRVCWSGFVTVVTI